MERVLKVFSSGKERKELASNHPLLDQYDGFVLLTASAKAAKSIAKNCPVEDITDQFTRVCGSHVCERSRHYGGA